MAVLEGRALRFCQNISMFPPGVFLFHASIEKIWGGGIIIDYITRSPRRWKQSTCRDLFLRNLRISIEYQTSDPAGQTSRAVNEVKDGAVGQIMFEIRRSDLKQWWLARTPKAKEFPLNQKLFLTVCPSIER